MKHFKTKYNTREEAIEAFLQHLIEIDEETYVVSGKVPDSIISNAPNNLVIRIREAIGKSHADCNNTSYSILGLDTETRNKINDIYIALGENEFENLLLYIKYYYSNPCPKNLKNFIKEDLWKEYQDWVKGI